MLLRNVYGGPPSRGRMGLGIGFFTHSVDENIFLMIQAFNNDYFHRTAARAMHIPFKMSLLEGTLQKKALRIAYFTYDGFLKVCYVGLHAYGHFAGYPWL